MWMLSPAANWNERPSTRTVWADAADQMHLDALEFPVVDGAVLEARQIEVAAELAIDALQQVQIEAGRDALGVVIGGLQAPRVLVEVDADDQPRAGAQHAGEMRKQAPGVRRIEVADRGARKEAELGVRQDAAPAAAAPREKLALTGTISRPGKRCSSRAPGLRRARIARRRSARRRAGGPAPPAPARSCGWSRSRTRPAPRRARQVCAMLRACWRRIAVSVRVG